MIKLRINAAYIFAFLALVATVWFAWKYVSGEDGACGRSANLLNQLMDCTKPPISKAEYLPFKTKLVADIKEMQEAGLASEVAVYFRDLRNGPTFGTNEKETFIPASLLKVPVMFTYLKLAEEDPSILSRTLSYSSTSKMVEYPQSIKPEQVLELDTPYTIDELTYRMIAYSDNRAYGLLLDYLKILSPFENLLAETYTELGMINPGDDLTASVLSTKTYGSLFRLLYNASYLSNEYSQKALEYLAAAEHQTGLRAGVPQEVEIAHKFGEHRLGSAGDVQLHDCGIVYYPENPYLLCVMARGDDFVDLAKAIKNISAAVYEELESRRL